MPTSGGRCKDDYCRAAKRSANGWNLADDVKVMDVRLLVGRIGPGGLQLAGWMDG